MSKKSKKIMSKILWLLFFFLWCAALFFCLAHTVTTYGWGRVILDVVFYGVGFVFLKIFFRSERRIEKKFAAKTKKTRANIIQYAKSYGGNLFAFHFFLDFFWKNHAYYTPYEKDLNAIITLDKYIRRGESVSVPQMHTEKGKKLWKQYIDAYNAEHSEPVQTDETTDEVQEPLPAGSWLCTCGRINPAYTSTCVCGVNKRRVPQPKEEPKELPKPKPPVPTLWRCTCGRENPNYTSTCVCGVNKRDTQQT